MMKAMNLHKNFIINAALCCLILGVVMWGSTPQVAAQNLQDVIRDDNLEIVINKALGRSAPYNQPISWSDLSNMSFTELNASGYGKAEGEKISDLRGLGYAVWLTDLDLSHNDITVPLLSSITLQLAKLNLSNNKITNLSELSGITTLKELNLSNNRITDISQLSGLTNLTHLSLANNSLEDTPTRNNGLDNQPNTEDDYFEGPTDAQAKLRHLSRFNNLEVLNVSHNSILNINVVQGLTALTGLAIGNNPIVDFTPIFDHVSEGVTVYTTFGTVANIPDWELRNALKAAAYSQGITSGFVSKLEQAASDWLNARGARDGYITLSVELLRGIIEREPVTVQILEPLRELDASSGSGYAVSDLTGLDTYCRNLEKLNLEGVVFETVETSYEIIGRLTQLKTLDLYQHVFFGDGYWHEHLHHLGNLKALRWLDLRGTTLRDITALAGLTALERLDLRSNHISTLEPLENLTNLQMLYLHPQNQVDSYSTPLQQPRELTGLEFQTLRTLADRIQHPWVTDTVIVKSYKIALEPAVAYGAGSNIIIEVTFQGLISPDPDFTGDPNPSQTRPYLLLDFGNEVGGIAEWIAHTYVAEENATKVEFAYPVHSEDREGEVIIKGLELKIPESGALVHWRPLDNSIFPMAEQPIIINVDDQNPKLVTIATIPATDGDVVENQAYPISSLNRYSFSYDLPLRSGAPIVQTQPTVQMRRAGGGTGAVTGEKFDVEITFSGPLDEPSAAALASKISLEENVKGGGLYQCPKASGRAESL